MNQSRASLGLVFLVGIVLGILIAHHLPLPKHWDTANWIDASVALGTMLLAAVTVYLAVDSRKGTERVIAAQQQPVVLLRWERDGNGPGTIEIGAENVGSGAALNARVQALPLFESKFADVPTVRAGGLAPRASDGLDVGSEHADDIAVDKWLGVTGIGMLATYENVARDKFWTYSLDNGSEKWDELGAGEVPEEFKLTVPADPYVGS